MLYPVPHRQYVFSIPIILRRFFKYDRKLLGKLCRSINQSLLKFFRTATGLKSRALGAVMAIQTFGDYAPAGTPMSTSCWPTACSGPRSWQCSRGKAGSTTP